MGDERPTETIPHVSDPLILHHSDSPSLVLVSQLLDGHNYGQWSRSMRIALSAKNKLGFIDGSIKNPATTDAKYPIWQRCNDMVLSWIWQSVQGNIAHSILYCKTASAVWRDLEDRFSQGNDSRIYQIRQEIAEHRQRQLSVSDYYTKLKALWDELASYHGPIACECEGSKAHADREEKEKVMQFLMGLNESYSIIRGSILMMSPLPDTRRVHGLVLQHERQLDVVNRREPIAHAMQTSHSTAPKRGYGANNPNSRKIFKCSYCDGGHPVERCFFLIGFPEGHKWHGKNVQPRNRRAPPTSNNVEALPSPATKATTSNKFDATFTTEEYNQLMALLRNKNGTDLPLAHATGHGYEEDDWPGQAV
ncbi:hypothetical protein D8674_040044 [Pyrus ussuriensis x Pyrus communis]|uniref:Retrotransposon Copia-like N-terminal domain-containing protein n=1 Tax=Pyrus ussuriensis x Pyrus communis TaxID=2448454 RepID=A0A5N5FRG0_9ROSA|nr:hypothetical protein D8674_040044 [Pyrus ussuriensis x Pyrus communis]